MIDIGSNYNPPPVQFGLCKPPQVSDRLLNKSLTHTFIILFNSFIPLRWFWRLGRRFPTLWSFSPCVCTAARVQPTLGLKSGSPTPRWPPLKTSNLGFWSTCPPPLGCWFMTHVTSFGDITAELTVLGVVTEFHVCVWGGAVLTCGDGSH